MKTKIGGKHIKKNIVVGDGSVWLSFIFCFQNGGQGLPKNHGKVEMGHAQVAFQFC